MPRHIGRKEDGRCENLQGKVQTVIHEKQKHLNAKPFSFPLSLSVLFLVFKRSRPRLGWFAEGAGRGPALKTAAVAILVIISL